MHYNVFNCDLFFDPLTLAQRKCRILNSLFFVKCFFIFIYLTFFNSTVSLLKACKVLCKLFFACAEDVRFCPAK